MYHINKEITGNGENIELKNTARHYFKSFDILGNSIQEGTPSIEFEAPIESVGDNVNLFDKDNVTFRNAYLNYDGTTSMDAPDWINTETFIPVEPNTKYVVSATSMGARFIYVEYTDTTYTAVLGERKEITPNTPFTTSSTAKYIRFCTNNINATNFKLSKGTKATTYSPYRQGSIEIKQQNANFFDISQIGGFVNCNVNNKVLTSSELTGNFQYVRFVFNEIPLKANRKCTISMKIKKDNGTYEGAINSVQPFNGGTIIVDTNKVNNPTLTTDYQEYEFNFTPSEDTILNRLLVQLRQNATNVILSITDIQIELGETATKYVEHQSQTKALYTQQPFRAIGDVKDRFIKVDNVWYEKHNIKRIIADGVNYLVGYVFPTGYAMLKDSTMTNITAMAVKDWAKNGNIICNKLKTVSTADIMQRSYSGVAISNEGHVMIKLDDSAEENIWTTESINNFLSKNPLTIDYELATPTLIECTAEQVEQLESLEKDFYSYDEVTHIYSTDEVSPYFEVTAYQRISEEFKTRLKEGKITRGYLKVLATDTLPEIIIDENNYLKDLKIEELRYVPEEGFIGGTVAKRVTGNFNNVDNSFDIQDREVEVYLGVELEDETTEYIKYGTYIVQRPEDDQVTDNTSFEALDYMIKFNQEYKDRITYPCTLKQLLDDIIDQAGVNSKVATFANSDFMVENNQFEQGSTLRDVLKAITQIAFNWSRIDADDNLVMDFEIREETDEELGTDDYFSFKKSDDYGPVNVVVLRNSQIEGENVTIKDEKLINSPKGHNLLPIETINTTINNVTIVNNGDGSITLNGATSGYLPITIFANKEIKFKPDTYTIKKKEISGTYTTSSQFLELQDENSQRVMFFGGISGNASLSQEKIVTKCYIAFATGTVFDNYTFALSLTDSTNSEKPYQPYIPVGEVELVIADNPFAYTELKRKQLIEAGRRLFGLRYTPMTVDMLGLMYLNAKDRISVENLNGEKFNTYLLDHTIDYTGIVLDSMESPAKTNTETKYHFIPQLIQTLKHTEIKADKAKQEITLIVEKQEGLENTIAEQKIQSDKISSRVEDVNKRMTNDYITEERVNSKIDGINKEYEILEKRVATTELSSSDFKVQIENIQNNGVDKITTSMGYTFNDKGLNINRDNADTGTIVDEAGVQVIDKTGYQETDILYAGYIKEDNTKYSDYVGQTIVSTTNLIVRNYLVVGDNSRFENYKNPILGGQGTGAFEI